MQRTTDASTDETSRALHCWHSNGQKAAKKYDGRARVEHLRLEGRSLSVLPILRTTRSPLNPSLKSSLSGFCSLYYDYSFPCFCALHHLGNHVRSLPLDYSMRGRRGRIPPRTSGEVSVPSVTLVYCVHTNSWVNGCQPFDVVFVSNLPRHTRTGSSGYDASSPTPCSHEGGRNKGL